MAMQKFNIAITVGTGIYNSGKVRVCSTATLDYEDKDFGYKIISTFEQEFDVPEFDPVTLEVESLEKAIRREQAESQSRVSIMLDRISKLRCLTHEVEAE